MTMKPAASSVRGSVTPRRETMSALTGTSYWIERPRSPRRPWPTHSTYWTQIGRSRPIARRSRAAASGLPSVPRMISAGSPGSTRITTKTRIETKNSVATRAAMRRATYCFTGTCLEGRCRARAPDPRDQPGELSLPGDLGEVERRDREVLPDPRDALLGDDKPRVHEQPHRRRLVGQHVLHPHVELSPLLVVDRHLGLAIDTAELRVVPAEVIARVGEVADVPGLGMPDDRHVVVGVLPHLGEPLPPLDLLDLGPDADLGELIDEDLGAPHRVVVLRRHLEDGVEAARISRLGQELPGAHRIIGHALRHVDEIRVQRIHVRAENPAIAEHRAPQQLVLVDGVRDRQAHALVRVGLLRVVERERDVVGGVAENDLEAPVPLQLLYVLRAEAERRDVDVARLEGRQGGV